MALVKGIDIGGTSGTKKKTTTQSVLTTPSKYSITTDGAKTTIAPNVQQTYTPTSATTTSSYKTGTDVANEKAYLNSLMLKGGGSAEWAKAQMKELNSYVEANTSVLTTPSKYAVTLEGAKTTKPSYTPNTKPSYTPNNGGSTKSTSSTPTQTQPQAPVNGSQQPTPYQDPQQMEMPQMPQQPTWEQGAPQQVIQQSATDVGNVIDSVRNIGKQYAQQSDEHAAAVAAQYTQMVGLLDQLEAQILGQIRSQMNGDDPGLQAAIGVIKEEAARMRDEALEELNARGLVQSGVYAESLSRLQKNELTAVQQTIAGQFNDLQTQLNNAMMSMAQARVSALSGHQSQLNSMLQADRNTQANLGMQGVGLGLEQRGQDLQNNQYYSGLQNQWGIANMQNQTDLYGMNLGAYTDQYKTNTSRDIATMQNETDIYGIDKNYAASIYGSNRSSGSGNSTAADRLAFDREMFDYDRNQSEAAIKEGQYQQMATMLDELIANKGYDYNQKAAFINNSRYPDDVKAWAMEQLKITMPQTQVQTPTSSNQKTFPLITWTPSKPGDISGSRITGSNSRRITR